MGFELLSEFYGAFLFGVVSWGWWVLRLVLWVL